MELAVSLAILSVMTAAMASAIVLAVKAVPTANSPAQRTLRAAHLAQQIAAELQYATAIATAEPGAIAFTVGDRNDDGLPETIRYTWAGAPGDPLTRQLNSGSDVAVLQDVYAFALDYGARTAEEETPGGESSEMLLATDSASSWMAFSITADDWLGQYFEPALPANATSWSVARVQFWARTSGWVSGEVSVQLRTPDAGGLPSDQVLEEHSVYESDMSSYSYTATTVTFAGVTGLPPDQGLCLVIKHVSGFQACNILAGFDSSGDGYLLMTTNGGRSFIANSDMSLGFTVYGTYTSPDIIGLVTRQFIQRVSLTLQGGPEPASAVHTAAALLNNPKVALE